MTEHLLQRRPLWAVYEHIAMVIGLGSLALMCLAWLPFAMLLGPVLPPEMGQRLGRKAIMLGFRVYLRVLGAACACRFDLSELDSLQHQGPLIIAANHPSLLDVVLIVSRLPNVLCVMKAGLMHHPLFGAAARLAGYIRNDGMLQIVQQSREALPSGAQVLIFPEGTRTGTFPLGALTPTLGLITQRSRVPVQTVILEYSTPYLGKAWPLWRKPVLPLHCRARLGRRFDVPTDHTVFTQALEAYFRQELTSPAQAAHDD